MDFFLALGKLTASVGESSQNEKRGVQKASEVFEKLAAQQTFWRQQDTPGTEGLCTRNKIEPLP